MNYRIFETEGFLEDLQQDFQRRYAKIKQKLAEYLYPQLALSPAYGPHIRKLKGYQPETWRFRIGDYHFFYQIDETEKIVFLIAADHRKQSYR
jgi:mRNA interferase RelE/StbE